MAQDGLTGLRWKIRRLNGDLLRTAKGKDCYVPCLISHCNGLRAALSRTFKVYLRYAARCRAFAKNREAVERKPIEVAQSRLIKGPITENVTVDLKQSLTRKRIRLQKTI